MIFFTSDTHFGHSNVIKYCNRPFKDRDEMDKKLMDNWNLAVSPGDEVYHLGDFSFRGSLKTEEILKQLNGKKYLIKGNHDHMKRWLTDKYFEWVKPYYELHIHDKEKNLHNIVILCHYPFRTWNHKHHGSWHLYGHVHNTIPDLGLSTDVGVDKWRYYPVSFPMLKSYFYEDNWS